MLVRPNDGDGVIQSVQGLVMGRIVPPQLLAQVFGVGDIDGEGRSAAAFKRGRGKMESASLTRRARLQQHVPPLARRRRGRHDSRGVAVELGASTNRIVHARRISGRQPVAIGPVQGPVRADDPSRMRQGVHESRKARRRRQT